jgi:outer membrane protein assembly factor BamD (BamD/ComL family)
MTLLKTLFVGLIAAVVLAPIYAPSVAAQSEDLAARMLDNARTNLRDKRYADGVKALELVIAQNPNTSVAADALLELATYHFATSGDLAAAQTAAESLTSTYRQFTNAAAMGWVMKGRILLVQFRGQQQMTTALSNFNSVGTIYPKSEPVPMAGYYAGETLRLTGQYKAAVDRLRSVISNYPTSPWAARALIASAIAQVADAQPLAAMETLQRLRLRFPGLPESQSALELNDQLYRLYVRPAAKQQPYEFSERMVPRGQARLDDVKAVRVTGTGDLYAVSGNRLLAYDREGTMRPAPTVVSPQGIFLDKDGALVAVQKGSLNREGAIIPMRVPKPDGTPRILEDVSAGASWSTGEYIVADPAGLLKFSADGKPLGVLAPVRAEKLAVNALDETAVLDRDDAIVVLDRDGKALRTLAKKTAAYEFKRPVDLTFDAFGHLLVLDRNQASVYVFSPKGAWLTTFTLAERTPGAFRRAVALAVDGAGRLYIHDDGAKRVQVYQ